MMEIPRLKEGATEQQRCAWEALHAQSACNPTALSNALVRACCLVRESGKQPKESPAVRFILHQLVFLIDGTGLPLYNRDFNAWRRDWDELEKTVRGGSTSPA